MSGTFSSSKALLASAREHLDDLTEILGAAFNQETGSIVVDVDTNTGEEFHKLVSTGKIHPKANTRAFNVATELRAALDQMVYAATMAITGKRDPGNAKFPIGDTAAAFEAELYTGANDVPAPIRTALYGIKPYEAGNRTIWRLNKLRNVKEHRRLIIPVAQILSRHLDATVTEIRPSPGPEHDKIEWMQVVGGPHQNELTFLRVPGHLHVKYDLKFSAAIVFGDPPALAGVGVIEFFEAAWNAVREAGVAIGIATRDALIERDI